jgi:hypothetical protein
MELLELALLLGFGHLRVVALVALVELRLPEDQEEGLQLEHFFQEMQEDLLVQHFWLGRQVETE